LLEFFENRLNLPAMFGGDHQHGEWVVGDQAYIFAVQFALVDWSSSLAGSGVHPVLSESDLAGQRLKLVIGGL
jgi:hypothetical protein